MAGVFQHRPFDGATSGLKHPLGKRCPCSCAAGWQQFIPQFGEFERIDFPVFEGPLKMHVNGDPKLSTREHDVHQLHGGGLHAPCMMTMDVHGPDAHVKEPQRRCIGDDGLQRGGAGDFAQTRQIDANKRNRDSNTTDESRDRGSGFTSPA